VTVGSPRIFARNSAKFKPPDPSTSRAEKMEAIMCLRSFVSEKWLTVSKET
jgi:hypothetical protein